MLYTHTYMYVCTTHTQRQVRFHKCVLNNYYVRVTVITTGDIEVSKTLAQKEIEP